jgi:hypothetical protein
MPYAGQDFPPAAQTEQSLCTFNFTGLFSSGATIQSVTWSCSVSAGQDSSPATKLIGTGSISGFLASHLIGGCLPGVTYLIAATATGSDGQIWPVWSRITGITIA